MIPKHIEQRIEFKNCTMQMAWGSQWHARLFEKGARFGYELAQEEVRGLLEALSFYAQKEIWREEEHSPGARPVIHDDDLEDFGLHPESEPNRPGIYLRIMIGGRLAREALQKHEEGRK